MSEETKFGRFYVYATAGLLFLGGLFMILAGSQDWALSHRRDVVFGIRIRQVLLIGGAVHLAVAAWVSLSPGVIRQATILLWVGLNHFLYRLALAAFHASHPLVLLRVLGMKAGIRATVLEVAWRFAIAWLIAGGLLVIFIEWRRLAALKNEQSIAEWRALRQQVPGRPTP
jgi:hypothetical protein